ncbi:MAG: ADP-ribosylglycohydrolase family protein [Herpetosiphonaceae bacterium]|nr:ADP-ribosylglycohydrolase family protein [Herpetosiphonaceae bacterium]
MPERRERVLGCLFGTAFGDALAAPTEFLTFDQIVQRWPPDGPADLDRQPSRVTDDTQMMLAVGAALVAAQASGQITLATLEPALRKTFISWLNDPENNRAPGMTCLQACGNLERGQRWQVATVAHSKGCGANMRVQPVGLLQVDGPTRAALAQFQAALTHGHPTGLAAADLTAWVIADLLAGGDVAGLTARLRAYAESQREIYHAEWLGDLWEQFGSTSPKSFIARGWNECFSVLARLDAALINPDVTSDPCLATGLGWIAEEALATGLLCFLLYPDEPRKALQRAAASAGDSDSIACLAGAFAGAYHGMARWPAHWIEHIEYREQLDHLAQALI